MHYTVSWAIPASLFPADLTFYDLMVVWLPHSWHRVSLVMANILTTSPSAEHRLDKADRLGSLHWRGCCQELVQGTVVVAFMALDNMLGLPYGASRALDMSGSKLTNGKLICREIQYRNLAENVE